MTLRGLTRGDLPIVGPWFLDQDTRRYLGGPEWPALMLERGARVVGETFRGAVQTGAYHLVMHRHSRAYIPYVYVGARFRDRVVRSDRGAPPLAQGATWPIT